MKTPRQFQEVVIDAAQRTNVICADELGLGKTVTATFGAKRYIEAERSGLRNVLVICSKRLRDQWREEIAEAMPGVPIFVIESAEDYLSCPPVGTRFAAITHFEVVTKLAGASAKKSTGDPNILRRKNWLVVVVDEAHRIKNRRAQRTKAVKTISAVRKIALTGTPMEKSLADFWSILNWVYPERYRSYHAYEKTFVDTKPGYRGYIQIVGNKNEELFATQVRDFCFQRTKADVAPELPPKILQTIELEMEGKQKRAYDNIQKADDIIVTLDEEGLTETIIQNALVKLIRSQQIAVYPPLLGIDDAGVKLSWLDDCVEDNPNSFVIFTAFREVAKIVAERYDADLLIGGIKGEPAADFKSGRKRILVGTLEAMAEGLNLQRANTAIFLDGTYRSITMQQAVDRIHRLDIETSKHIIFVQAKNSVDKIIKDAAFEKWDRRHLVMEYIRKLQAGT